MLKELVGATELGSIPECGPQQRAHDTAARPFQVNQYGYGSLGGARPALRDSSLVRPVTLTVLADDPLVSHGAAAYLGLCKDIKVLAPERRHEAEVALILVSWITEETLVWMQRIAAAADGRDPRFVIVGDGIREHHVIKAVSCGLVSVIPRKEADFERILKAVRAVRDGRLEMPEVALGWLVNQLKVIQQDILEPRRLTTAGLEFREVEALRLLGEGLSTAEIAVRLNYSERTVKNIIHGVLIRLNLRNRTQAVAYALQHGAL
jgi:DNA-binding NarL/FixJ family response regulator